MEPPLTNWLSYVFAAWVGYQFSSWGTARSRQYTEKKDVYATLLAALLEFRGIEGKAESQAVEFDGRKRRLAAETLANREGEPVDREKAYRSGLAEARAERARQINDLRAERQAIERRLDLLKRQMGFFASEAVEREAKALWRAMEPLSPDTILRRMWKTACLGIDLETLFFNMRLCLSFLDSQLTELQSEDRLSGSDVMAAIGLDSRSRLAMALDDMHRFLLDRLGKIVEGFLPAHDRLLAILRQPVICTELARSHFAERDRLAEATASAATERGPDGHVQPEALDGLVVAFRSLKSLVRDTLAMARLRGEVSGEGAEIRRAARRAEVSIKETETTAPFAPYLMGAFDQQGVERAFLEVISLQNGLSEAGLLSDGDDRVLGQTLCHLREAEDETLGQQEREGALALAVAGLNEFYEDILGRATMPDDLLREAGERCRRVYEATGQRGVSAFLDAIEELDVYIGHRLDALTSAMKGDLNAFVPFWARLWPRTKARARQVFAHCVFKALIVIGIVAVSFLLFIYAWDAMKAGQTSIPAPVPTSATSQQMEAAPVGTPDKSERAIGNLDSAKPTTKGGSAATAGPEDATPVTGAPARSDEVPAPAQRTEDQELSKGGNR